MKATQRHGELAHENGMLRPEPTKLCFTKCVTRGNFTSRLVFLEHRQNFCSRRKNRFCQDFRTVLTIGLRVKLTLKSVHLSLCLQKKRMPESETILEFFMFATDCLMRPKNNSGLHENPTIKMRSSTLQVCILPKNSMRMRLICTDK